MANTPYSAPTYLTGTPSVFSRKRPITENNLTAISTFSGCCSGSLAKVENEVAIFESPSSVSRRVLVVESNFWLKRSSWCLALSIWSIWILSFIGVSVLLISWATWRAMVRHASSRSLLANRSVDSSSWSTILLYSSTISPTSSLWSYCRWRLRLPNLTCLSASDTSISCRVMPRERMSAKIIANIITVRYDGSSFWRKSSTAMCRSSAAT